jgi:hypothetical protein
MRAQAFARTEFEGLLQAGDPVITLVDMARACIAVVSYARCSCWGVQASCA